MKEFFSQPIVIFSIAYLLIGIARIYIKIKAENPEKDMWDELDKISEQAFIWAEKNVRESINGKITNKEDAEKVMQSAIEYGKKLVSKKSHNILRKLGHQLENVLRHRIEYIIFKHKR